MTLFFERQEVVLLQEEPANLKPPYITLCPVYHDQIFLPILGFENKELTFEKYTLMQERNFLLKNFTYKG